MKLHTLTIIIPVYNEQRFIKKILHKVLYADSCGLKKEIIIVNDGSTDKTARILKKWPTGVKPKYRYSLNILSHSKNQGKGAAVKTALSSAKGDLIIIQDSDLEYNPKDYPALIKPFLSSNISAVYGSRTKGIKKYNNKYSNPFYYLGGLILTWYMNRLYSQNLSDQPTGYKILSKNTLSILSNIAENDFTYEIALTAMLSKNNIKIVEVPITYQPRTKKEGKKINLKDFFKSLYIGLKYKMR